MIEMTVTDLVRNFSRVLDRMEHASEEVAVVRNKHVVARLLPGAAAVPAMEVFADLYGILADDEGAAWLSDTEQVDRPLDSEMRDPWASS